MKHRLLFPLVLLAGFAATAHAELRLMASATSDSYQSLTYGLSAFCQAAGFPFALTEINDKASELLLIPNLAGIDVQRHLWLFWLAGIPDDPQAPDVVSVAILPATDNATAALHALTNTYPLCIEEPEQHLWRYQQPALPLNPKKSIAPVIYVAVHRGMVIVSVAREAVLWAINRPMPAPPAGASTVAGQVRFEFQPSMIAPFLAEKRDRPETSAPSSDVPERMLADIRALTLVLEATTEGVTARLSVTPVPDTRLARLFLRIRPPAKSFWELCPEQAAVAMAGGGSSIWRIPDTYGSNRTSRARNAETLLGDCRTGDSAVFIGRISATGALYYAEIMGITNRAVAWDRAQADPPSLLPFETSFRFASNSTRMVQGTPVLDLIRGGFAAPTDGRRNPADMAAFMVRDGGISVAATSNHLVVTFGPSNAIEQVLQHLANPPATALPLPVRCRKLLPDLPDAPCSAVMLQPAGLVRQIALSLPGLKQEWIADLPQPGDGIAAAITRNADNVLHLTLRVSANEVSRLTEFMNKGHKALQELFMQMALQQMLQIERKLDAVDPRDPKRQLQR